MLKKGTSLGLVACGVVLDYVAKRYVQDLNLEQLKIKVPFLKIVHVWNKGISWGFFSQWGLWLRWILVVLTFAFIGILSAWYVRSDRPLEKAGLILMISGALGNWLDRMIHGAVFDFLSISYRSWHFPAFNLADILISVGFLIVMKESLTCIVSHKK